MNSRPNYFRVGLLLSCAAALTACNANEAEAIETINTYTVSREDLPINVKEGGGLVAVKETVVRSLIEGNATILSLVPEGTLVKPGDKLVELDVSSLVEKRSSQEIAVGKALNALEQAKTAGMILEKELITKRNTADSQRQIATMNLEKLLGAKDGKGSEGRNKDMVTRLKELVTAPTNSDTESNTAKETKTKQIVEQVRPENYAGLIPKVIQLLKVAGEEGDPLERDMGEMANKIRRASTNLGKKRFRGRDAYESSPKR